MNIALILLILVPVLMLVVLAMLRRRILISRPARVGVALAMLPVILFCAFGFLASFEGSDASFVAFRVGYAALALVLGGVSAFLLFGRVRRREDDGVR